MKFVIVTQDVGPGHSLRIISDKLAGAGHRVENFLGQGKPLPEGDLAKISAALVGANYLLVSVSSTPERVLEERHAFQEAKRLGVPVAVFSDIYGMYHRPWFTDLMAKTDTLFVIDEHEAETAKNYVGKDTKIIATGNPYWTEFFKAKFGRDEVRTKLGIKPEEKMVLAVGNKELERNVLLYTELLFATQGGWLKENVHLVLTLHPGANHTKEVYDGILKWSTCPMQFPPKEAGLSSQDMIAGSDLVVCAGGSSVGIMAACQRKPVIDLINPIDHLFWKELSGLDFWPPVRSGASTAAIGTFGLARNMYELLNEKGLTRQLLAAQEANFSLATFENAAEKIVAVLTN